MRLATLVGAALLAASVASAQSTRGVQSPPRPATLAVQVVDPSGAGIPSAHVISRSADRTFEVTADLRGAATFSIPAGSYEVVASANGFDARTETVRLTAGLGRRVQIELPLSPVLATVTVAAGWAMTAETTIGAEEFEALPDAPEALEEFIRDIAGPEATITVDGFQGGGVPPKEQVAQVVVVTDPYSAQFHEVGYARVDVITKPGFGQWEGRSNINFSSDELSARNPFAREKLPFQNIGGRFSASGPLTRLRTSLSLEASIRRQTETQPLVAVTPAGFVRSEADQRDERQGVEVRSTHALGTAGILRNRLEWDLEESTGEGLDDVDLPERAYRSRGGEFSWRSSLTTQLPRRIRQDLRIETEWNSVRQQPLTESVGLDVLGEFRSGGAQVTGTRRSRALAAAAEWLLPTGGRHTLRTGALVEHVRQESSNVRNYLGTFVFEGLDAYVAGEPTTFTQRIGSTDIAFSDTRTGLFIQDDIRLSQAWSVGLGVRQEFQPSISDMFNLAPRLSLAWASESRTTVRFGLGAFYTWHDTDLMEEARRLEGDESYELVIRNPGYPDPFVGGSAVAPLPPTRLITADNLSVARTWRASATFEKRFARVMNVRGTLYRQVGSNEPRSRNVNAPVDGARPDPASGNVLLLASTGRARRTSAEVNLTMNGVWGRRIFGHVRYTLGEYLNDADGALSLPADSLRPDLEWGPARQDIRHRGFAGLSFRVPDSFSLGVNLRWQSAAPYTITSGEDTNGDTVTNDRPQGVGRNSERGDGLFSTDVTLRWNRPLTGARSQRGSGRGGQDQQDRQPEVGFTISARNVFNQPQYGRFNGVITSRLFNQPISAQNPRRIDLGMNLRF